MARRAAAAGVLLLLVACTKGGSKAQTPGATVPTAPPFTTTTTTNPYAVPAVIDAAYVNRVLAGLDAAVGDVTRLVLRTRTIPREAYDRLRALYGTDALLQLKLDSFQSDLAAGPQAIQNSPGNKVSLVKEIISGTPRCIYARVDRDYSAVFVNQNPNTRTQWIALQPVDSNRDPSRYNPSGWAFVYEGFERGFVQPTRNPCAES